MTTTECTATVVPGGYACKFRAGHPGYHETIGGRQWVGEAMNRDGSRPVRHVTASDEVNGATLAHIATCPECSVRFGGSALVTTAAAEARRLLAQPKPATGRDPLRWGRERWHFAGRVQLAGAGDRYRWELRDGDHVLDTEYRAVSSLVRPVAAVVDAREGE